MKRLYALCLGLCLTLTGGAVWPGAWPRETGTHFSAFTLRVTDGSAPATPRLLASLYHEYGLGERTTLTLDLGAARNGLDRAMIYLRQAAPGGDVQLSAALGLGTVEGHPTVSPRLLIGRGLSAFGRSGWAEAVASAEFDLQTGGYAGKLDLTLGLNAGPDTKTYLQLFAYQAQGGDLSLRAEASAAFRLRDETWLDLGLSRGLTAGGDTRLKVGLWTSF